MRIHNIKFSCDLKTGKNINPLNLLIFQTFCSIKGEIQGTEITSLRVDRRLFPIKYVKVKVH